MLPGNAEVWGAFLVVEDCRRSAGMGLGGCAWGDARAVLDGYGIRFDAKLHRKLRVCFDQIIKVECDSMEADRLRKERERKLRSKSWR